MTSKANQLFLELYLLRLRYTDAEISEASNLLLVMSDPELQVLMGTLKQMDAAPARTKTAKRRKLSRNYLGLSGAQNIQKAIAYFAERLAKKRVLQNAEELERFAQSIGARAYGNDRSTVVRAVREALESLPPMRALESIQSVDDHSKSGSDAYVNLAKTLMRG